MVKNPTRFAGHNAVIVEVQTPQLKNWRLADKKYTAFVEFSRTWCGAKFIKAVAAGRIDINIFDTFNPKMKGKRKRLLT